MRPASQNTATTLDPKRETSQDLSSLGVGAAISLTGKVSGRALHVLGLIILARWLGAAALGLYAIGFTVFRAVGVLGTLGLENGVIRFAPEHSDRDPRVLGGLFSRALVLSSVFGTSLCVALYLCAPWMARQLFHKVELIYILRMFALAIPLQSIALVAAFATRVSKRMQYSVYAFEFGQPAVNLLLLLAVYLLGWRLFGAVIAIVLSFAFSLIAGLLYVGRLFPTTFHVRSESYPKTRDLLAFSLPTSLSTGMATLAVWVDRLVMAHYRPASEVGIYHAASQCAMIFMIVVGAFDAVLGPMVSFCCANNEMRRLRELIRVGTKWTLYAGLPVSLFMITNARGIMAFVFGPQFVAGWLAMVILVAGQLVNVATGSVGTTLILAGGQKLYLWLSLGTLLLSAIGAVLLVPIWGAGGAAFSTALGLALLNLLCLFQLRRRLNLWPYDARYRKGMLAGAASAVALLVLHSAPIHPLGLNLVLRLLVMSLVFVGVLLLLGLDREDREFIDLLISRARGIWSKFPGVGNPVAESPLPGFQPIISPPHTSPMETNHSKVKVLYVAGWGRSGSTILGNILGQLEGFVHVGEVRHLWHVAWAGTAPCGCGMKMAECPEWEAVFNEGFGPEAKGTIERMIRYSDGGMRSRSSLLALALGARQLLRERLAEPIANLEKLYPAIQKVFNARFIVDSSKFPTYAYALAMANNVEMYVLHLIRDPRAVAFSWRRVKVKPEGEPRLGRLGFMRSALLWDFWNGATERFAIRHVQHYMQLRYEDFVWDPLGSLRRVLEFTGVESSLPPFSDSVMQLQPQHTVAGNPVRLQSGRVRIQLDSEWAKEMGRMQRVLVTAATWPFLWKYGYADSRRPRLPLERSEKASTTVGHVQSEVKANIGEPTV